MNRGELRLMQVRAEGWRPGQDISGVVLRQPLTAAAEGRRARCRADRQWRLGTAGRGAGASHGAMADNVRFEQAAALPVAGLTALCTLRHGAPLLGKRVLMTGAAGGVGHMAVQIGADRGPMSPRSSAGPSAAGISGAPRRSSMIDKAEGRFGLILEAVGGASLAAAMPGSSQKGRSSFREFFG